MCLANCYFVNDPEDSPRFCDEQPGHSFHQPLYIDRCLTGAGRNGGIRAIVGPHGPKNQVDDVQVVTVNAEENSSYRVLARSSVRRAPHKIAGCHYHENLLESYSCKGV